MTLSTSLRILLAEDNRLNQRFAVALLEKHGHTVDIASNGVVAVEAVLHGDYDIVLMDIQMPELDGVAATKQIRTLAEPKCLIPIVAMTANAMSGARAEYLAAGMDAYISKPFELETLMAIIDRLTAARPAGFGESIEPSSAKVAAKPARDGDPPKPPVLDTTKLDAISDILSQNQLHDLQSLYLKDAESHIAQINALALSGDLGAIAHAAHDMVSTAGNIGALETSALARLLEETCRRGEQGKVGSLIEALNKASNASTGAIRSWMDPRLQSRQRASSAPKITA